MYRNECFSAIVLRDALREIWNVCLDRFSDFLVNEIDASGRVVRLTSIDAGSSVVQQNSSQPKLPALSEATEPAKTEEEKPPAQSPAATAGGPATGSRGTAASPPQPDWAETVKGFADVLPAESYFAVVSFYNTIAAFEAARSGIARLWLCICIVSCATWEGLNSTLAHLWTLLRV